MDSLPEGDTKSERQELASMALNLRRAKRKLFLKSVERPTSSVDQLREILLQVSVDALEGGDRPGLDVKDGSFRRHERTASFD